MFPLSLRAKRPFSACSASYAGLGVRRSSESEGGSNPAPLAATRKLDCLVAITPRNDGGWQCVASPQRRPGAGLWSWPPAFPGAIGEQKGHPCCPFFGIAAIGISRLERPGTGALGNEPSTVLAEDSPSSGFGNADSRRKLRVFEWGGRCRPRSRDFGCVPAHPHHWRASASYRPLRAVWAVCAWALRGSREIEKTLQRPVTGARPKRNLQP